MPIRMEEEIQLVSDHVLFCTQFRVKCIQFTSVALFGWWIVFNSECHDIRNARRWLAAVHVGPSIRYTSDMISKTAPSLANRERGC